MNAARKLLAGLLDAGLAALATFLAGVIAVRLLDTRSLAVYAVLFSATVLGMLLPRQLHYVPAQLAANLEPDLRAPLLRSDLLRAVPVSAGTFLVVLASGLTLLGTAPLPVCLALGVTGAAYAAVSPFQDHVRAALHLVDRHYSAAACSVVLALVVGGGAVAVLVAPRSPLDLLAPFGLLLLGNLISVALGTVLLRGAPSHRAYRPQPFGDRARLLLSEAAVQGAWFACNYAVLILLGAAALAHLETARILASPLTILATALVTFMGPAVLRRLRPTPANPHGARNDIVRILATLVVGGAVYLAVLAVLRGPVGAVLAKSVDLGLTAARLGEVVVEGASTIVTLVVFALGRTRETLAISVTAGVTGLAATIALAPVLGLYALPVGQAIGMAVRLVIAWTSVGRVTRAALADPQALPVIS
ncbi:MAG TPA: hypothetical protein VGC94_04240 [Amnibacterium sp.]